MLGQSLMPFPMNHLLHHPFLAAAILTLATVTPQARAAETNSAMNPLLAEWNTPFGVPPFAEIKEEHFLPAIQEGMARQKQEIAAITASTEAPTFHNTVEALEFSGEALERASAVFGNLTSAETNEKLQALARELAPLQAAHRDSIVLDKALFQRIQACWDKRTNAGLAPDQMMLLERTYKRFIRGGAALEPAKQERLRAINTELASLSVSFGDNLLKEMNTYRLVVTKREDLAGLPESLIETAARTAEKDGKKGAWSFTLHAPTLWPFMQYAQNRSLREQIFKAYISRCGQGGATDNHSLAARTAALRCEKARLLGFTTWADFTLDENMAKTPAQVYELLNRLWTAAKSLAGREAEALQEAIKAEGKDYKLEPWDWFYYAEKVRQARYSLDEEALRPYFQLEKVRDGAFWVANRLYGVTFTELKGIPAYHEEVKAFEVKDADGSHLALFYMDYHPRPGKRSGAWASRFRSTYVRDGKSVRPVSINVCNFSRPTSNAPALLTLDEVETLFHELGHGLHSMLSRVRYRSLGATPTDFVELPSQIMENWAFETEVLERYARHWRTGEVIPPSLVDKIHRAKKFNQGFKTVEYLAASLLDLEWHTLPVTAEADPSALERIALARMGVPSQIVPRYRTTYFQHIFAGGYSSGYYSYIWADVLVADAYKLFEEKGIFDPATARSFRENILEKGYSEEPMVLYERFRGRPPAVEPLIERRGLN
jgi:peptidyl-dipeptidase Dcp